MPVPFEITILGNNSAIPAHGRNPSGQLVQLDNSLFLVDCGEGTQARMVAYKSKAFRLSHIFISHLHGDHFFGLVGLLNTLSLLGRTKDLHLYCHEPLKELIDLTMRLTKGSFSYSIHYHFLPEEGSKVILHNAQVKVTAFQLEHRGPTCGFLFEEQFPKQKIDVEILTKDDVPVQLWGAIQRNEEVFLDDGSTVDKTKYIIPHEKGRTYAYCCDTRFTSSFLPVIKSSDCIYVDCTYLHEDKEKAHDRFHCTAIQAARIAKEAGVNQLIIGHFSSKYRDVTPLLNEAKTVFEQTILSEEGKTIAI